MAAGECVLPWTWTWHGVWKNKKNTPLNSLKKISDLSND